jgi:L-iditol 2-dehydrogenase
MRPPRKQGPQVLPTIPHSAFRISHFEFLNRMKALLLSDYRRLEVVDFPDPQSAPDEVVIRVLACGICGSDVHGYDGSTGRRIPPLVMGHEAAGVIESIGSHVKDFHGGQRVTFDSTVYCGQCEYCRDGRMNLCDNRQVLGVSCGDYRRHGAFAELVAVPERIVYPLPDEFPLEHAALIEAVSVAVHAVKRVYGGQAHFAPKTPQNEPVPFASSKDAVAVIGSGMIGLLIVQVLRQYGCRQILAVDVDDSRLELARQLGATDVINSRNDDAVSAIINSTNGRGASAAWEAVGATATVTSAVHSVRKGGHVVLVGNISPTVELPLQAVVTRELTLHGSCASSGEYPECIRLMATGAVDVRPLISAKATLEEAPSWFERLYNREPNLMKVVLHPNAR